MKHYQSMNTNRNLNFKKFLSVLVLLTSIVLLMLVFTSKANAMAQKLESSQIIEKDVRELYLAKEEESNYYVRHEINNIVSEDAIKFYVKFTGDYNVARAIFNNAIEKNVPINLAFAIAYHESRFNPMAYNNNGTSADRGLFQLNDYYRNWTKEQFYDIETNVNEGVRYFKEMIDLNDGDYIYALYCYNAGPTKVRVHGIIPDRTKVYANNILEYEDYLNREFNKWLDEA